MRKFLILFLLLPTLASAQVFSPNLIHLDGSYITPNSTSWDFEAPSLSAGCLEIDVQGHFASTGANCSSGNASTSPGGLTNQVQFNGFGSFVGDSHFTWASSTQLMTIAGSLTVTSATSSSFQNLIATSATTTNATTTNLQVSGMASTSALRANTGVFAGFVGFGTTTPEAPVSFAQTGGLLSPDFIIDGVTAGTGAEMELNRANTGSNESNIDFDTAGNEFWQLGMQDTNSNDFELWDGLDNPVFTIKQGSNETGIATATPYAELTVWGDNTGTDKAFEVSNNASTSEFSVSNSGLSTAVNLLANGSTTLQKFTAASGTTTNFAINGLSVYPIIATTTASLGGGLLTAGSCASVQATTTQTLTTAMAVAVTPTTYPGDGTNWDAFIGPNNTVTVKVCGLITVTPTATTYNVRIFQ